MSLTRNSEIKDLLTLERPKRVTEIFKSLQILPSDIIPIIVTYWFQLYLETKPFQTWPITNASYPAGIVSDHQRLYVCVAGAYQIYSLEGSYVKSQNLYSTWATDLTQNHIYILGDTLSVMNFDFQNVGEPWKFSSTCGGGLKVDEKKIYVTLQGRHQIFVYTLSGQLVQSFGSTTGCGDGDGIFTEPRGMALDKKFLYVCDRDNHRIQVLDKESGNFHLKWGKKADPDNPSFSSSYTINLVDPDNPSFFLPYTINLSYGVIYVGDQKAIQLFTCEGKFLQRLNRDFNSFGMTVTAGCVYVSNYSSHRIHVYRFL